MAFFDGVLAEGPNHPIFNTLILGYMKGVEWYISGPSFMCVWFIVPEFSNFKWFRRSRKYNFRLTLGSFLAITPQNGVRYVSDLDQQCSTRQWIVYVTFFVVLLENVGNSAKKLILWHFLGVFGLHPFTTYELCPIFWSNERSH